MAAKKSKKGKRGRPKVEVSDEDRERVREMSRMGATQVEIATVLGVSDVTLRAHFRKELDTATVEANSNVAGRLYDDCMKDDPRYQTSRMFWLKTRGGWKEKTEVGGSVNLVLTDADKRKL
jgi:hypothetical protein